MPIDLDDNPDVYPPPQTEEELERLARLQQAGPPPTTPTGEPSIAAPPNMSGGSAPPPVAADTDTDQGLSWLRQLPSESTTLPSPPTPVGPTMGEPAGSMPSVPGGLSWRNNLPPGAMESGVTPETPPEKVQRTYKTLAETIAAAPPPAQPKWWQRAIAGGLGGIAGYVNAAGRVRHPIETPNAQDIANTFSGQPAKIAAWQQKIAGAEAEVTAADKAQAAWMAMRKQASEEGLQGAEAKRANAAAAYDIHRAEMEKNQWKIDPKGKIFNTITGEYKETPATPQERYDQAVALGFDPEHARYYAVSQPIPAPEKTTEGGGHWEVDDQGNTHYLTPPKPGEPNMFPNTGKSKPPVNPIVDELLQQRLEDAKNKEAEGITNNKTAQEKAIIDKRNAEVQKALESSNFDGEGDVYYSQPDARWDNESKAQYDVRIQRFESDRAAAKRQITGINQKYAPQLQAVQNNFAANVRRRGVTADDYDVDPNTLQYRLRSGATPAAVPGGGGRAGAPTPKYTEAQVRQRAIQNGLDPDKAVANARQRGLLK